MKGNTINPAHEEASAVDAPGQGVLSVRKLSVTIRIQLARLSHRTIALSTNNATEPSCTYVLRFYAADCTASVLRCAVNVWRLASSV
jgi:hypothetical protein